VRCQAYLNSFDKIKEELIQEQYITKYGQPIYHVPLAIINREKRQIKAEAQAIIDAAKKVKDDAANERRQKKEAKEKAKEDKLKEKARKAKALAAKKKKKVRHVAPVVVEEKKKRTRRTKSQMAEARSKYP
jgi:hypothetical protein